MSDSSTSSNGHKSVDADTPILRSAEEIFQLIAQNLKKHTGGFAITYLRSHEFVCSIEWGREAPDSPIVGAAAYGTGATMAEAVNQALDQTGWRLGH